MTFITLFVINKIVLAFGLASSVVVDVFLIFTKKTHKITGFEKKIINRTLSYSFLFSIILLFCQFYFLKLAYIKTDDFKTLLFFTITTIITIILVTLTSAQKYYQINILYRQQEKYHNLSDSFLKHHKELGITAVLTLSMWIILYLCFVMA